jgi:MYXO-CTERM domain-containing protein
MLNRFRSSLLLLSFGSFAFAATPALAQDALDDAAADALAPDGGESDAADAASDASDASDALHVDATPDAGRPDTITPTPDAASPDAPKADASKPPAAEEDDGCGCRIGAGKPGSAGLFTVLGAVVGIGLTVRRRRRG